MKVTIKDIALLAGVSHSTVSRALNNNPQISLKTKELISTIAKDLDFEFNASARSLKKSKTGNIAIVYEANIDPFGLSLYLNQLFTEVRHILEKMGMDVILLEGYHPETGNSNIYRLLRQQKVDGFLIVHDGIQKKDYENIKAADLPLVQLHINPLSWDKNNLDYFFTDNFLGGYIATDFLIKKGCRKILTVFPDDFESYEYKKRKLGYKKALSDSGISFTEEFMYATNCTYKSGYEFLGANSSLLKEIDGIFFQTDIQAFGFLVAAREEGINIPKDLKIIGYDDVPICESTNPQLTTIHQPRKELAKLACERIVELINADEKTDFVQKIIEPLLVERGSA